MGSAGEGTTAVTAEAGEPTGRWRETISSTLAGSPERRASTVPSRRLRTHPARPRDSAVSAVQSRNPTPCTRPFTTTRTALRAGVSCGGGDGVGEEDVASAAGVAMASPRRRQRRRVLQRGIWSVVDAAACWASRATCKPAGPIS
ncbi:Os06g0264650 [Oryza sativa Japonica Group]|uniref:Os06g0264650 protein n=1 Tax=Oryza sativa subsp. japonica TaxID=39947 RepID=A0A0P0WVF2_ORYSJ|nr:hypothetical protein EE612_033231 [Oryza sativa]BAS97140.1 Os06g0264650 [Oryza sativa Japonica Group]